MALTKVQADGINLADTFDFTGTVSGSNFDLLGHQNISADTTEVIFDNILTSDYGQVFATGEVVTTSGTDCSMDIHYRTGGASGSTVSSNMAHFQGDWSNRAASGAFQGNVLNGTNAYLRIGTAASIKGGSNIGFEVSWRTLRTAITSQATNVAAAQLRHGSFAWSFEASNAFVYFFVNGWFRATSTTTTHTITGLRFVLSSGNMQDGTISVYGKKKT